MQLRKSTPLELVKQELAAKKAQRIHANQGKNNDLDIFKCYGGLFIEDSDVNAFLKLNNDFCDEKTELNMLYYQDLCNFVDLLLCPPNVADVKIYIFCHVPPKCFPTALSRGFFHQNKN